MNIQDILKKIEEYAYIALAWVKKIDTSFITKYYRIAEAFILSLDFKNQPTHKKSLILGTGAGIGFIALWIVIKIGGLLLFSTCSYVVDLGSGSTFSKKFKAVNVEAAQAKVGSITKRIATVGTLRPNDIVTLKSEMNGRITAINFREGTDVKKGDLLIQFDDGDAKAELKEAEAQFILREADFKRSTELKKSSFESTKKFDEAKAAFAAAEAKVEAAKSRFAKTQIIAPFDGTVGLISLSVGTYTQVAQELVTIVDNNPMKVDFKIPEKNLHDVGVGQVIEVKLDGFPDQVFSATVEAIDAKIDPASHSIAIRGSVPNPKKLLRGGLFANISLITGEKGDAILIPEAALEREGEIEYVWTINKNKAARKRILVGTKESEMIEVVAGLAGGEFVVTAGQLRIGEGSTVKIVNLNEDGTEKPKEDREKADEAQSTDGESSKGKDKKSETSKEALTEPSKDTDKK